MPLRRMATSGLPTKSRRGFEYRRGPPEKLRGAFGDRGLARDTDKDTRTGNRYVACPPENARGLSVAHLYRENERS